MSDPPPHIDDGTEKPHSSDPQTPAAAGQGPSKKNAESNPTVPDSDSSAASHSSQEDDVEPTPISVRLVLSERPSTPQPILAEIHEPVAPGVEVDVRLDDSDVRIRVQTVALDPSQDPPIAVLGRKAEKTITFPILRSVRKVFSSLRLLSIGHWLREWGMSRGRRAAVRCVDWYILSWLLVEAFIVGALDLQLGHSIIALRICAAIAAYRILELVQVYFNILLFDPLQHYEAGEEYFLYSSARSVLIAIVSYVELIVCYSVLYTAAIPTGFSAESPIASITGALYFSTITVTTLGYGEIQPIGVTRLLCMTEAVLGVLFTVTIIARFLNFLPSPGGEKWRR